MKKNIQRNKANRILLAILVDIFNELSMTDLFFSFLLLLEYKHTYEQTHKPRASNHREGNPLFLEMSG